MRRISLFSMLCILLLCSCENNIFDPKGQNDSDQEENGDTDQESDIQHVRMNQEVSLSMNPDDDIEESNIEIDIDNDGTNDFIFSILDLRTYGDDYSNFDSPLAACVYPLNENNVLDNSGYSYLTTLDHGDDVEGQWAGANATYDRYVLGTIGSPTDFPGAGPKYMGIQLKQENGDLLTGWIQLDISADRDHIHVISAAYQLNPELSLDAGQTQD